MLREPQHEPDGVPAAGWLRPGKRNFLALAYKRVFLPHHSLLTNSSPHQATQPHPGGQANDRPPKT